MKRFLATVFLSCLSLFAQAASLSNSVVLGVGGPAVPTFSVACGNYSTTQNVTLATGTSGGVIYFTTNGTTPTTASAQYTSPIPVTSTSTLSAITEGLLGLPGAIGSCTYNISSGAVVKWNPGHYIIPNQRPNPSGDFSTTQTAINDMDAAFVSSTVRMTGVQVEPPWYQLETPAGGCYYFDPAGGCYTSSNPIDQTLAAAATKSASRSAACACTVDYKVIIYLPVFESQAHGVPVTPQAAPYGAGISGTSIAPDYVINAGCVFASAFNNSETKIWNPTCMGYIINLVNKLGAIYDANPHVEFITAVYELGVNASTTTPSSVASDPTYSVANLTTQLQSLSAAMTTSWPTTQKAIFANYGYLLGSTGTTSAQLNTQVVNWIPNTTPASNIGWALGGPDILYPSLGPTTGDQINSGTVGGITYIGKIGELWEEQANAFNWTAQCVANTESYAFNTLGASHEAWADIVSGEGSNTCADHAYWVNIVTYLQSVNFRVNATRPTSYK